MRKFSHTKVLSYSRCPRIYQKKYIEKIVPKKKSDALILGEGIAAGLAEFRSSGSPISAMEEFVRITMSRRLIPEIETPSPKMFRSVKRGAEILEGYMKRHPDEPETIVLTEQRFAIPLTDTIIFEGKLDAISKISTGLALIEDKTTSRLGDSFFDMLKKSSQITWYLMAANDLGLLDDKPKCILNAIYSNYAKLRYERDITTKSIAKLEDARQNLKDLIQNILDAELLNRFPKNNVDGGECVKYGGCDYLILCSNDTNKSMQERLKQSEFDPYGGGSSVIEIDQGDD